MSKHDTCGNVCEHEKLTYCKHCKVVHCLKCAKEWKDYTWTATTSVPYTSSSGIYTGLQELTIDPNYFCKHEDDK